MNIGLSETVINSLLNIFSESKHIDSVVVFGSRALGNFKESSDVDLALFGKNLQFEEYHQIMGNIDDLNLPYQFDVLIEKDITNLDLKEHIREKGKLLFKR